MKQRGGIDRIRRADDTQQGVMRDWSIPGAAIAFVRRNEPNASILSLGLRQWDRSERIDERTMFGIASITETFVAAGIGLLVQTAS